MKEAIHALGEMVQVLRAAGMTGLAERGVILDLFQKAGLQEVEGIPLYQWWERQRKSRLDEILIRMEDQDPGVAAEISALMEGRLHGQDRDEAPPA